MHANASLTPADRQVLVQHIASGRPIAHVAAEMGIARQTASRWWRRWLTEGDAGASMTAPRAPTTALVACPQTTSAASRDCGAEKSWGPSASLTA